MVFKTDYRLMQVKSIAQMLQKSILRYVPPSLSYHLSLRSLFLSIFEWPKTCFTVFGKNFGNLEKLCFEQVKCIIALNLCDGQLLKMGILMYAS